MEERNEFLEVDGLYWQSDTHEWFHDKISTGHAQKDWGLNKDALPNIFCFVVRNKESGEYNRVVMDSNANVVLYSSKSLEEVGFYIDKLKIQKRYN
jgi:hypothetical protein